MLRRFPLPGGQHRGKATGHASIASVRAGQRASASEGRRQSDDTSHNTAYAHVTRSRTCEPTPQWHRRVRPAAVRAEVDLEQARERRDNAGRHVRTQAHRSSVPLCVVLFEVEPRGQLGPFVFAHRRRGACVRACARVCVCACVRVCVCVCVCECAWRGGGGERRGEWRQARWKP